MDLARYLADSQTTGVRWWLYRFPNGKEASVVPDPRPQCPFRFELLVDVDQEPTPGLTTAEVEAKLTELAQS